MRKRTITAKFRRRVFDNVAVPELRLEGNWFRNAGFEIGDVVEVVSKKGQVVIRKAKSDEV